MKNHCFCLFVFFLFSLLPINLPAQTVVVENGKAMAHIICADKDSTTQQAASLLRISYDVPRECS